VLIAIIAIAAGHQDTSITLTATCIVENFPIERRRVSDFQTSSYEVEALRNSSRVQFTRRCEDLNATGTLELLYRPRVAINCRFPNRYIAQRGPFRVSIEHNSIHDYARDGIWAVGSGVFADVIGNSISGVGPSSGSLQWGVFILNGAYSLVRANRISEGLCGTLQFSDCFALRSEGIVLRIAGDGTIVENNVITNAQFGVFLNGGNRYRVTNNLISNIDGQSGIHLQGHAPGDTTTLTNTLVQGNTIYNLLPQANRVCGVDEEADSGLSGNHIVHNAVNDAYCGVAKVFADVAIENRFFNTAYEILDIELLQSLPEAREP
jgi:hypothetical protein